MSNEEGAIQGASASITERTIFAGGDLWKKVLNEQKSNVCDGERYESRRPKS